MFIYYFLSFFNLLLWQFTVFFFIKVLVGCHQFVVNLSFNFSDFEFSRFITLALEEIETKCIQNTNLDLWGP